MSWEKSSYTTAGAALLSESLSGGALTITRAVSGTGINPIKNESAYRTSPHTAAMRITSRMLTTDDMSNSYP